MDAKRKYMLLIVLLFLAVRFLTLFSYEVMPDVEGYRQGILANQVITGNEIPLKYYQFYPVEGGSFIASTLTIPFFYFFGVNGYAIRILPIIVSMCILMLIFLIARDHISRAASIIAGLLYIFSPVFFTLYSHDPIGVHMWPLFFIILSIYLGLNAKKRKHFLILGAVMGLGFYMHNSYILGALITLIILFNSKLLKKHSNPFCIAFLIGFIPKIVMIKLFSDPFYHIKKLAPFDFFAFWSTELPSALDIFFPEFFSLFILLLIILGLFRIRQTKFALFALLFVMTYSVSSFKVYLSPYFLGYRYFVYFIPLMILLLADSFEWFRKNKMPIVKWVGLSIIIMFLVLCTVANIKLINLSNLGRESIYKPYDYKWLGGSFMRKSRSVTDAITLCNKLEQKHVPDCYEGIGFAIANHNLMDIEPKCNQFGNVSAKCFEGVGYAAMEEMDTAVDLCHNLSDTESCLIGLYSIMEQFKVLAEQDYDFRSPYIGIGFAEAYTYPYSSSLCDLFLQKELVAKCTSNVAKSLQ